jgi:signal transduction histidine kinase
VDGCLTDILENSPLPAIVTLERSLAPDLAVMGDPALLNIALGNVIRNARDAMPSGGTLRLAARADGDLVEIRVQDTGVGIPPENLPRIFEPLYSTKAKGIGLGLSIAHEIFTRHLGTLRVASEVGVGTTFTIQLPRALAPP